MSASLLTTQVEEDESPPTGSLSLVFIGSAEDNFQDAGRSFPLDGNRRIRFGRALAGARVYFEQQTSGARVGIPFPWVSGEHCEIEVDWGSAPKASVRDLQSRNVLVREGRPALIDLQGAFLAPPEYDAVSLLRDSYVTLPEPLVARWCEELRPTLPDAPSAEAFALRFALLTISRKGKDFGRFAYVAAARGDAEGDALLAPTGAILKRAARRLAALDPAFRSLAELIEALPGEPACAR